MGCFLQNFWRNKTNCTLKKSLNEEKKSLVKLGMENVKGNNVGNNDMIIRIK
jgi:ribosomal protein L29